MTMDIFSNKSDVKSPRWQQEELGWSSACSHNYHVTDTLSKSKREQGRKCQGYRADGSLCFCPCHKDTFGADNICSMPGCNFLAHYRLVPVQSKPTKKRKHTRLYFLCRVCHENKPTRIQSLYMTNYEFEDDYGELFVKGKNEVTNFE